MGTRSLLTKLMGVMVPSALFFGTCGANCNPTPVPPTVPQCSPSQYLAPNVQSWHFDVVGNQEVCVPSSGPQRPSGLIIDANRAYTISAQGRVQLGGVAGLAGSTGPGGNGNAADSSYPLPGQSSYSLIYRLKSTPAAWKYVGWGFDGGPIVMLSAGIADAICFEVNDNRLDDNSGKFDVDVIETVAYTCRDYFPVGGSSGGSSGGRPGDGSPPTNGVQVIGQFSCAGTISINGEDCTKELGTDTTCVRANGALWCPAIRQGCTCTCQLGPCPNAR